MTDEKWRIEGEFRDGSARSRASDGRYESVSNAILDEVSETEVFSEGDLAARLNLDEAIVIEHLFHLREHGLIEGEEGSWMRDQELRERVVGKEVEHLFPWERDDVNDSPSGPFY